MLDDGLLSGLEIRDWRMAEKRRISNIEQGILNDEVRMADGREKENIEYPPLCKWFVELPKIK